MAITYVNNTTLHYINVLSTEQHTASDLWSHVQQALSFRHNGAKINLYRHNIQLDILNIIANSW